MSAHSSEEWLLLFFTALVVILFVFYLVRRVLGFSAEPRSRILPRRRGRARFLQRRRSKVAEALPHAFACGVLHLGSRTSGHSCLRPMESAAWVGGGHSGVIHGHFPRVQGVYTRHTWSESARPVKLGHLPRIAAARRLYLMAGGGTDGRDPRLKLGTSTCPRACTGALERASVIDVRHRWPASL